MSAHVISATVPKAEEIDSRREFPSGVLPQRHSGAGSIMKDPEIERATKRRSRIHMLLATSKTLLLPGKTRIYRRPFPRKPSRARRGRQKRRRNTEHSE